MNSLLLLFILMVFIAALFLLIPLLGFSGARSIQNSEVRNQKNIDVFNQSLKDLDNDLNSALISSDEFEKLKAELQRSFIRDMEEADTKQKSSLSASNKMIPFALLSVLFIAGYLFYQLIGSGQDLVIPELLSELQTAETEEQQTESLTNLAAALNGRFQRHTDNIQMGYSLGGIYLNLEEFTDAARIFSQLADKMEDSPDKGTVLGQLAQSQYLVADSIMTTEVQATIEQALSMNPNEQAVMSLLAIDAFVNLKFQEAIGYWRRQLIQLAPGSAEASVIRERISRVEELIPADELSSSESSTTGVAITVSVDIDDSIRNEIADDMRLFIFARGETMPMPLAAQTFSLNELPVTVTLDESMAMTPQFTLANADRVYVGARISRVATAQSGDFQALSDTFVAADQTGVISLTIKDMVP